MFAECSMSMLTRYKLLNSDLCHGLVFKMPALVQVPTTPTPCQGLYANISILEHSCINNASKHFDGDNRVVIRAAINIKKGEHISINYSDPMWGTANRQLHLGQSLTNTMNIM